MYHIGKDEYVSMAQIDRRVGNEFIPCRNARIARPEDLYETPAAAVTSCAATAGASGVDG
jgi:hypothetical protein